MMADLKEQQFVAYGESSMGIGIQEIETHLFRNWGYNVYNLLKGEIGKSMLMWDSISSLSKA
jgi:hypothetical protein